MVSRAIEVNTKKNQLEKMKVVASREGNKGEEGQRIASFQNNYLKYYILNDTYKTFIFFYLLLWSTDFFVLMFKFGGRLSYL